MSPRALLLLLTCAWSLNAAAAFRLDGMIVGVADGDTVTLLEPESKVQHRIRLADIDAPESRQDYGQQSKRNLSNLVYNQTVTALCKEHDKYGRAICTLYLGDQNINTEQVRQGLAWVYRTYAPRNSPLYRMEDEARAAGRGLWQLSNPTPPWEWRRQK